MRYQNNIGLAFIAAVLFMAGCIGIEPLELQTDNSHYYRPSDYQGLVLTDQVLFDFREGLGGWWADKKYNMALQGSALKLTVNGAGPKYSPFGVDLGEPMNFSNAPVIRVKMKLPEGDKLPVVRIDLRDVNGKMTNAAPAATTVKVSEDYIEYFFDINHKWKQSYPNNSDVDNTQIDRLQFFVNPGGEEFYGTLFIDEIYVMANKDGSGKVDQNIVIDDFTNGGAVDLWWPCKPEKVNVSMSDKGMKVHFDNAQWDCFGKIFGETDITNTPIIRIKAKAESNTPVKVTNIMARFIDINENATDLIDGENMADFEVGGSDYQYYYSAFKTKYENNLYSSQGDFDPTKVNRIIIFFNMNKETDFTGDIYVQEVAFVNELPYKIKIQKSPWGAPPAMEPGWKKAAENSDFSGLTNASNWKVTKGNATVSAGEQGVKISGSNIGVKWDEFTVKSVPFNLDSKVVVKIKARVKGAMGATLRLDVFDDKKASSNGRPQSVKIDNSGEFKDYYVNMSTNYYQRAPKLEILNVQNIQGLKLYVNGGQVDGFTGDLEIAEIQPISLDDAPEAIKTIFD